MPSNSSEKMPPVQLVLSSLLLSFGALLSSPRPLSSETQLAAFSPLKPSPIPENVIIVAPLGPELEKQVAKMSAPAKFPQEYVKSECPAKRSRVREVRVTFVSF